MVDDLALACAEEGEDSSETNGSLIEDDGEAGSDDSFGNMSEVERLAFLEERDKFLNEECARIAQLPDPTSCYHRKKMILR